MAEKITDPELLKMLNAGAVTPGKVTDPALLAQLNDKPEPYDPLSFRAGPIKTADVAGGVNQFAARFNRSMLAIPTQLALGLEKLIGPYTGPRIPGVSDIGQELMHVQGYPTESSITGSPALPPPEGGSQEVLAKTGEFTGAAAGFGGGTQALSQYMTKNIVKPATSAVGGILENLFKNTAAKPGTSMLADLASGGAAGIGAGTAEQAGAGPGGQGLAALGAGMSPALLPLLPTMILKRLLQNPAKNYLGSVISEELPKRVAGLPIPGRKALGESLEGLRTRSVGTATEAAQKVLRPELSEQNIANLARANLVEERIPGTNFSLAEKTQSPALAATQRQFEGQATGLELDRMVSRHLANQAAVQRFGTEAAPEGPEFATVIDSATGRVERSLDFITDQRQQLASGLPKVDLAATGETLRTQMLGMKNAVSKDFADRAAALGIADQDVTGPFLQWAQSSMPKAGRDRFEDITNVPKVIAEVNDINFNFQRFEAGEINHPPAPVTFSDLKRLRERISDDLIDQVGAANPSTKAIRELTLMKKSLDEMLDGLPFGDAYKQFRKEYFEEFVKRFENSGAYKMRQMDQRAFYQTADEKVAGLFFKPNDVRAARQFKTIYANDKKAMADLQGAALDDFRRAVVRDDGLIDPKRADAWLRQHASVLAEFPELNVNAATMIARNKELFNRSQQIETAALSGVLRRYEKGGLSADGVLDNAMRDTRTMAQLLNAVKTDDAAMMGLNRAVWDRGTQASNLDDFLNNKSVQMVLTPTHRENLKILFEAGKMTRTVPVPGGEALSANPYAGLEQAMRMGIPQFASRAFAVQSGRTSWRFVGSELLSRVLRGHTQDQADALLKGALYDPKVAQDLVDFSRAPDIRNPAGKRIKAWMLAVGADTIDNEVNNEASQ